MLLSSPIKSAICQPINTVFEVNCDVSDGLTPVITEQPQDQTVNVNATPTFTVAANVDSGTLEYQWQTDVGTGFTDMPLETSASLTLPPVALSSSGHLFRVRVRANGRNVFSRIILLIVVIV